jgi:hypothetical protein
LLAWADLGPLAPGRQSVVFAGTGGGLEYRRRSPAPRLAAWPGRPVVWRHGRRQAGYRRRGQSRWRRRPVGGPPEYRPAGYYYPPLGPPMPKPKQMPPRPYITIKRGCRRHAIPPHEPLSLTILAGGVNVDCGPDPGRPAVPGRALVWRLQPFPHDECQRTIETPTATPDAKIHMPKSRTMCGVISFLAICWNWRRFSACSSASSCTREPPARRSPGCRCRGTTRR